MVDDQKAWDQWRTAATAFGVAITKEQIDRFRRYADLLQEWNERINLTAIREPEEIRQRHFLDAAACAASIMRQTPTLTGQRLIDIGTGAGFPGLALKIIFPELAVTLVDSVGKKTAFLEVVTADLGLALVEIIHDRAENVGQDQRYRERFDWVTARSVARLNILVELLLPLARVGGFVLSQKGESGRDELREAEGGLRILGGRLVETAPYRLPGRDIDHYNLVIEKIAATPADYPRRAGVPAKRPLK